MTNSDKYGISSRNGQLNLTKETATIILKCHHEITSYTLSVEKNNGKSFIDFEIDEMNAELLLF